MEGIDTMFSGDLKLMGEIFSRAWLPFVLVGFVLGGGVSNLNNGPLFYAKHFVRLLEFCPQVRVSKVSMNKISKHMEGGRWDLPSISTLSLDQLQGASRPSYPLWGGAEQEQLLASDLVVTNANVGEARMPTSEVGYEVANRVASAWTGAISTLGKLDALYWEVTELEELDVGTERPRDSVLSAEAEFDLLYSHLARVRSDLEVVEVELRLALRKLPQQSGEPLSGEHSFAADEERMNAMQNATAVCAVNLGSMQWRLLARESSIDEKIEQIDVRSMSAFIGRNNCQWANEPLRVARSDMGAQAVIGAQSHAATWRSGWEDQYNLMEVKRMTSGDRIVF
ncbi:hypothetical protein SAMN05660489_06391 [Pseudomonas sp. LAMO17WK12:I10]|uniref:hypothetical protein n=1 Tax=unclassified Pseudomonas TaxID=196821 RepID=UPI000BD35FC9|nr:MULTISPECIES: hypothetical protein [unclassified Pseudomonas]PXX49826.1 hypothetical protein H160_06411 [Pseudomonas sp. LAMO17WK12:I9]SNY54370.1 hypothetical protein SAMN05660489_06391 [Pseudomonas sp. LAMO17WK12:I10]